MGWTSPTNLHALTMRDIRARQVVSGDGRIKQLRCGCEVNPVGLVNMCQFHEGYDLGLEAGEARATLKEKTAWTNSTGATSTS